MHNNRIIIALTRSQWLNYKHSREDASGSRHTTLAHSLEPGVHFNNVRYLDLAEKLRHPGTLHSKLSSVRSLASPQFEREDLHLS